MSDAAVTQEDIDEQSDRLREKRARIRSLAAERVTHQQQANLEITKVKLDDEEARLDAELEEAEAISTPEAVAKAAGSAIGLEARKAEMQAAAEAEAEAAKATKTHRARGPHKPADAGSDDSKGE